MKPMIFNTEMARAILDGRKTVTRRAIKPQPHCYGPYISYPRHEANLEIDEDAGWLRCCVCGNYPEYSREGTDVCHFWKPPYRPGDILYVRETWCYMPCAECESGCSRWTLGIDNPGCYIYKADGKQDPYERWRPSIHMPKDAARLFLRVTDVRVERLQSMRAQDSLKEGVPLSLDGIMSGRPTLEPFVRIWDSTITPKDRALYGWDANPWVWVIEFERIEKFKEADVDE